MTVTATAIKSTLRLRVWWIPQVPMKPFVVNVSSVKEGARLLHVLAEYDIFQFENRIKPDYCNVGGLETFEYGEWCEWEDEDGDGIDRWMDTHRHKLSMLTKSGAD